MNDGILGQKKQNLFSFSSYPTLTKDENNFSLSNDANVIRLSSDATRSITGFGALQSSSVTIYNVGSYDIRIVHQSANSLETNRVISATGSDLVIGPNDSLTLVYDNVSLRWRSGGAVKVDSISGQAGVYSFYRNSGPSDATFVSAGSWTWNIPSGAKLITIDAIGAGQGGGSGRRGAAGTARGGGGGGAGGGRSMFTIPVVELGGNTNLTIVVGTGGAGAAAVAVNDTNGNTPAATLATIVRITATSKILIYIWRTNGAGGGTTTGGAAGYSDWTNMWPGSQGGAGSNSSTAAGGSFSVAAACGGGGGGGIGANDVAGAGGGTVSEEIARGAAAVAFGTAGGGAGVSAPTYIPGGAGGGGSGGGGNASGAGGNGGNGAFPGGGGGGGGASLNGFASGAGGNGADGFVKIYVWY
jgi:hypothetical protein